MLFSTVSEISSSTPGTVFLGRVSYSSLKFARMTNAQLCAPVTTRPCCDFTRDWRVLIPTRENTRAGGTPLMGIRPGSTQTSEWIFCPFSKSSFPFAACWHRGATVTFSVALTSHDLLHRVVTSERGLCEECSSKRNSSRCVNWGLRPAFSSVNTVNAARFVGDTFYTRDTPWVSVSDILPHWKLISAPVLSKKSMPNKPAASVGSCNNKSLWLILRPSRKRKRAFDP